MRTESAKIGFCDMYAGFSIETSRLAKVILENFNCEISDKPDLLVVGPYSHDHLKYDCVKIFFTGENMTPDFNLFDYAIGFDHMSFGDRYVRVPLWAIRSNFAGFREGEMPSDEQLLSRKFCSFVVSNSRGNPMRTKFFHELSKYKRVDSGGWYLNNVGGPVDDKMSFISGYKFNIAFENSSYPGYTTEKIMDPLSVWSVPIYWGDPLVTKDFSAKSMITVKSDDDIDRAIAEIIALDRDDAFYLEKCKAPCLMFAEKDFYMSQLIGFLKHIFDQPLEDARRLTRHGFQGAFYRPGIKKAFKAYDMANFPINVYRRMRKLIRGS